jgi:small subunit ribosomal protein S27Ae
MGASRFYKIEGDKLERLSKACPKCGPGTFMANHKDRKSCGKCGFLEKNE